MHLARTKDADWRPVVGPAAGLVALFLVCLLDHCPLRTKTCPVASQHAALAPVPASHKPCRRADPTVCPAAVVVCCHALDVNEPLRPFLTGPELRGAREARDARRIVEHLDVCDTARAAAVDDGGDTVLGAATAAQQTITAAVWTIVAATDTWTRPLDAGETTEDCAHRRPCGARHVPAVSTTLPVDAARSATGRCATTPTVSRSSAPRRSGSTSRTRWGSHVLPGRPRKGADPFLCSVRDAVPVGQTSRCRCRAARVRQGARVRV